jgi:phosphate transport system substrate-binding protein
MRLLQFSRTMLSATALTVVALASPAARGLETVQVGGTGMALATARELGRLVTASDPEVRVNVHPSMGTKGGLRALADGVVDVALAARDLTPDERADALSEAACMVTPLVFVTSHPSPEGVARAALPALFADAGPTWADGTALKVILRARSGTELPYLASQVPGLKAAFDVAYMRPGIAIGSTDQANADLAVRIAGSFAVMSLMQIRSENVALHLVPVDGISPSPDAVVDGSYPFSTRICLVIRGQASASVMRLVEQARSAEGAKLVASHGAILVK